MNSAKTVFIDGSEILINKSLKRKYSRFSLDKLLMIAAEGISTKEHAAVLALLIENRSPSPAHLPVLTCLCEN